MQITLDQSDIETAVKEYIKTTFNVEVPSVDIGGTKGKLSAVVNLAPDKVIQLGAAELEILGDKPKENKKLFKKPAKEEIVEEVIEEESPFVSDGPTEDEVVEKEGVAEETPKADAPKKKNLFGKKVTTDIVEEEDTLPGQVDNSVVTKDNLFAKRG